MGHSVIIAGATGLVGNIFLRLIQNDPAYDKIIILTRREIPFVKNLTNVEQHIIDFEKLEESKQLFNADYMVCTLGTTIKKAGTKENFYKVDHDYPLQAAQYASGNGCKNYILVSAIGADPGSGIFYNRVKGEVERDIKNLNFESLHILRPSLILGDREEYRFAEQAGKVFAGVMNLIFPDKYKPVNASVLAKKIDSVIKFPSKGFHFYEGKQLYI